MLNTYWLSLLYTSNICKFRKKILPLQQILKPQLYETYYSLLVAPSPLHICLCRADYNGPYYGYRPKSESSSIYRKLHPLHSLLRSNGCVGEYIGAFEEKIHHLADMMISIDLDDGVKVNYEKVQTAPDGKKMQILKSIPKYIFIKLTQNIYYWILIHLQYNFNIFFNYISRGSLDFYYF